MSDSRRSGRAKALAERKSRLIGVKSCIGAEVPNNRGEKSPFEGRLRRMIRVDKTFHFTGETISTLLESSPQCKRSTSSHIPPSKGDCTTPLCRGDRLRSVQRSNQGCVEGALSNFQGSSRPQTPAEHTPRLCNSASLIALRISPLQRGFTLAIVVFVVIIIGVFTQTIQAQRSGPHPGTPQIETGTPGTIMSPPRWVGTQAQGYTIYPQLEEYLQIAMEQNPELLALHSMLEADRERIREAGVLMDPEITIAYDFNPMMYDSYLGRLSVSAMQMFPWFGTLEARRGVQRSAADASRAEIISRQLEILREVQISWFDIAEIREQIRVTEEILMLVRDLEILVETRYETGRAGQADILRIQMEEQRLKTRIADLEDRINPLTARFNELLSLDPKTEVETADELRHTDMAWSDEEVRERIRRQNPIFDRIEAERSGAENELRLAQLDGRPGFGIGVEVMGRDFGSMSMFPDASESIVGMATVRVPLFRSRYDSQRSQAGHRIRSLDLREQQTENRLMADLEQYLEEVRRSERSVILLTEELVPRAQQALTILSEEYSVGSARFDELLQIQRELLELEFERIEAVVQQNQAVVNIESLMGGNNPLSRGDRR